MSTELEDCGKCASCEITLPLDELHWGPAEVDIYCLDCLSEVQSSERAEAALVSDFYASR